MKLDSKESIEAVLYVRSNNLKSFNLQKLKGKNYAEENSISIKIIMDLNTSGLKSLGERPGLQSIVKFVKRRMVKTIILDSLHRVSRDSVQLLYYIKFLRDNQIKLVILDGGF